MMGDVSIINKEESEELDTITNDYNIDLMSDLKINYRYYRKKISKFIKSRFKKEFTTILYISQETIPTEYILSLQKTYPDKIIKVILPTIDITYTKAKEIYKFEYTLCNKKYSAQLYRKPIQSDNIEIFEIYTNGFESMKKISEIYNLKYLSHYTKCIRIAAKKLKPDIIHSDNVPYFLGMEFNGITNFIYPIKVVQTVHDSSMNSEYEPFWAMLNLANKKDLKRLLKDKIIKKNLAALFGVKKLKPFMNLMPYADYLYNNYEKYIETYGREAYTNENILLRRLDVLKIFSSVFPKNRKLYNIMYYTLKRSNSIITNTKGDESFAWPEFANKSNYVKLCYSNNNVNKITYPFDITNFREYKKINKQYLIKEFAKKRIETKFTDSSLFAEDDVKICGYLDSFYSRILVLLTFNNYTKEEYIKKGVLAILKAFEQQKNIEVIFNFSKDYNSSYKTSLIEFIQAQEALDGRWISIDGDINLPQFTASSDIVLMPTSEQFGVENLIYTALKNGCIPVAENRGIFKEIIIDIYDDLSKGCGFKHGDKPNGDFSDFEMTFFKAISFYTQNPAGWNLIIKNAINTDSSWDINTIEKYNNIYEEL